MARSFLTPPQYASRVAADPIGNEGTIWFRFKPAWNSGDSVSHRMVNYGGAGGFLDLSTYLSNNCYMGFLVGADYRMVFPTAGLFTAGQWANWMFTWSVSLNAQRIHKDKIERFGAVMPPSLPTAPLQLSIGGDGADVSGGEMAEVARWNRVLTLMESSILQASGNPACVPSGLIHHWKLTGTDSPELDTVGSDHLTLQGAPAAATHPRVDPVSTVLPLTIPNCTLWLRGDTPAFDSYADGDPITAWIDETGNPAMAITVFPTSVGGVLEGRAFVGAAATRPTYQTAEANGKPVVRFDGIDDQLTSGNVNAWGGFASADGQEHDSFIVLKEPSGAAALTPVLFHTSGYILQYATSVDTLRAQSGLSSVLHNDVLEAAQPVGWNSSFHIVETWRSYANAALLCDGAALDSAATMGVSLASGSVPMYMGSWNGGAPFANADIAEVVFYSRALTGPERAQVTSYLQAKYFASSAVATVGAWRNRRGVNRGIPKWPFTANPQSRQAKDLALWYHGRSGGWRTDEPGSIHWITPGWVNGLALGFQEGVPSGIALPEQSWGLFSYINGIASVPSTVGMTISFWLYFEDASSPTEECMPFLGTDVAGWGTSNYFSRAPGTSLLTFVQQSNVFAQSSGVGSTTVAIAKRRYLLTGVSEHSNLTRFYVNGILEGSGVPTAPLVAAQPTHLLLGGLSGNPGYIPVSANVGDIRIYNRALSAREVWALYDPATRYELYQEQPSRRYFIGDVGAVAVTGRPSDHHHVLGMR